MAYDPQNRVFTNVKTYMGKYQEDTLVLNNTTQNPTKFPALMVSMIDSPEVAYEMGEQGANDLYSIEAAFELQANSNKSTTEARKIILAASDAMRLMGFHRTYGPSYVASSYQRTYGSSVIAAQTDQNLHRMVARFERILSPKETIKKFTTTNI